MEDYLGKIYKVEALEGENMMNAGIIAGVPFQKACGGNAECTTCHVYVPLNIRQNPDYKDAEEKEIDALEFATGTTDDSRLACQICINKVYEGSKISFLDIK